MIQVCAGIKGLFPLDSSLLAESDQLVLLISWHHYSSAKQNAGGLNKLTR